MEQTRLEVIGECYNADKTRDTKCLSCCLQFLPPYGFIEMSSGPTMADGLDLDGLGDLLFGVRLRRLAAHLGFEECVHQRGLSQATLPCNCTT